MGPILPAEELERLRWWARKGRIRARVGAQPGVGPRVSPWLGRGLDLAEVRAYAPGDEVRHMDWRATARRGKPYTKLYRAERERVVALVVDRRPAMFFGTRDLLKVEQAARGAALLSFAVLQEQGLVGGWVMDGDTLRAYTPTRRAAGMMVMLGAVGAAAQPGSGMALALALTRVATALQRAAEVVVISDFHDLDAAACGVLQRLRARHYVSAWRVVDTAEEQLPEVGKVRLRAPEGGAEVVVDTASASLRARYAQWAAQRGKALTEALRGAGADVLEIYTHESVQEKIAAWGDRHG